MDTVTEKSDFPENWLWGKDDDTCAGSFVRFDKGATKEYGKKLILVLEVEGKQRSVWLLETALTNQVREELAERPDHTFGPGERLVIRRLEKKQTEDGKRSYHPFRLYCPDRPEVSAAEFFGFEDEPAKPGSDGEKPPARQDDDIPF